MAVTFNTHTGNSTTGPFSFTFEYIDETDVKVSIDGTTQATTAYTFPTASTIQFVSLTPTSSQTIRIFRETDVDDLKATFFAGSSIRSQDLNNNFEQNNFAVQEIKDQFVTEENGSFSTNVDMNSNRITELADPVDAQDAVTKQYLEDNYFDDDAETILSNETWASNDTSIASTQSIDNRVDSKIDTALENDVLVDSTGLTKTGNGGQVTLGIAANSVDLDRIKDSDKITLSEQEADNDQVGTDDQIFTAKAATRRFNNYYQNDAPTDTDGVGIGQVWVDPNDDLTLSVWTGSAWSSITSGGTFTNQPKVVYVDATSGDDNNDGHRISRPKATIKAAVEQINADATHGNGSIVVVAPGVYQEACPIQIEKRDVAIVGTSLRQCVIHPTAATETATMFEVNSGTYLKNLTFTGMKASGTRGDSGSLWENSTYGLPPTQGWNVAFYNNAYIYKSPYIQNCTNFSDSEIDNSDLDFYAGDADKGRAGDTDSAPTGGGLLVDGSTPHEDSPLRSIVCDSYTHTGLDAPGIFVTNNGYMQATSSYAFFCHAHITCINGGQANLAASTSDFGRYGLIASGKSTSAIFTSTIDGAVSDGATSFNIDAPTAGTGWHGTATRPAGNMLVTVNSVTYPILSATANGSGWTVTISRPSSTNRSTNLGVDGAISDGANVEFFLRSMIASSGHTMEYVGSGTNYSALPENGGVPNEDNQKIELDDGKIWTATTDQNGKFSVGGNQTDDPFFEVDQQLGFVTIPEGSIAFNLLSDTTPELGGELDANSNKITSLADPTADQDAATKAYVDSEITGLVDSAPGALDTLNELAAALNDDANFSTTVTNSIAERLALAGGTMTGAIAMGTNRITGLGDPTAAQDAATRNYVDTNALSSSDIGSTVQAFDADTAKTDVAQTFTAAQRGEITTLTDAATVTPDFDDSNNFTLTFTNAVGNSRNFANPSNLTVGQSGSIFLIQDGTGSRTVSWGDSWDFAGGTAPTLTTDASAVDRVDYIVRTTTSIHAVATLNLS